MLKPAVYPSLENKVVMVTGGATGIGADIVRAFHAQGARVGFLDIQDAQATALLDSLGATALRYRHCDVTNIPALESAIQDIASSLGPIDVLVNNAARDTRVPIDTLDASTWDAAMAINLRPHFFTARAVRAGMASRGGGAIINLSSIAWHLGMADLAHYTAAKAGIVGLTHSLARAFGDDNIRVNAIEPGAVMTERQRRLWYPDQASVDAMVGQQLIKTVLDGQDIARMVLFLASDDARLITKQTFVVDAGLR